MKLFPMTDTRHISTIIAEWDDIPDWDPKSIPKDLISFKDKFRRTLLYYAILLCKECQTIEKLLSVPAIRDLVVKSDSEGRTPLYAAIRYRKIEFVRLLLGEKISAKNRSLLIHSVNHVGNTPLHLASKKCDLEIAKYLFEVSQPSVEAMNMFGQLPIHYAARSGNVDMIRLLIRHGSPIDTPDKMDRTPFHFAALYAWYEVLVCLLQHGSLAIDRYSRNYACTPTAFIRYDRAFPAHKVLFACSNLAGSALRPNAMMTEEGVLEVRKTVYFNGSLTARLLFWC